MKFGGNEYCFCHFVFISADLLHHFCKPTLLCDSLYCLWRAGRCYTQFRMISALALCNRHILPTCTISIITTDTAYHKYDFHWYSLYIHVILDDGAILVMEYSYGLLKCVIVSYMMIMCIHLYQKEKKKSNFCVEKDIQHTKHN